MLTGTVEAMSPSLPGGPSEPPADPDEWTDEQWLAWLEATDPDDEPALRPVTWRFNRTGSVLGAAMLGLRDAIYGHPDNEVAIVQEVSDDPPDDDLHDLRLDPEHPERSEVVVRPRVDRPGSPDSGT